MKHSVAGRKPRILFVLPATVMGGAEIRLLQMVRRFHAIEPVLLGHGSLIGSLDSGVEMHALECWPGCRDPYPYHKANLVAYGKAISGVARETAIDGTFGWMHNGSSFVAAAKIRYGLRGRTAGCVLGPLTTHFALSGRTATFYERLLFGVTCRTLDLMVTPSRGVADDLSAAFLAPRTKLRTIYNGVDLERSVRLARSGEGFDGPGKSRPWIVAAGRLSLEKGYDVLVRAFAGISGSHDAELFILGEGPEREKLECLVRELGLQDRVHLPGLKKNPFPWFVRADVFVSSSRLEGFGNSLVEAMGLGVPVIATACQWGPLEILQGHDAGVLVPVDGVEALAEQLSVMLSEPAMRERMSEGGRRRAQYFSFDRMLSEYEQALLKLFPGAGR